MDSVTAKQGFAKLPELSFGHPNVPSEPFRDAGGPPVRRFFSGSVQKREAACEVGCAKELLALLAPITFPRNVNSPNPSPLTTLRASLRLDA